MINAILLHSSDNVVTVTQNIPKGETVIYAQRGVEQQVIANEAIPQFHKISIRDISKGSDVIKYGEKIGYATKDILCGQHVHTQNIDNKY